MKIDRSFSNAAEKNGEWNLVNQGQSLKDEGPETAHSIISKVYRSSVSSCLPGNDLIFRACLYPHPQSRGYLQKWPKDCLTLLVSRKELPCFSSLIYGGWSYLLHSDLLLWIFKKSLLFFLMNMGCYTCIYVCMSCVSLVPMEPRTGSSAGVCLTFLLGYQLASIFPVPLPLYHDVSTIRPQLMMDWDPETMSRNTIPAPLSRVFFSQWWKAN